jgi:hypothetical protein
MPTCRPGNVAHHVGRDAQKPCPDASDFLAQLVAQPPGLQKGEGHDVLGEGPVTRRPDRMGIDDTRMLVENLGERRPIARPDPFMQ